MKWQHQIIVMFFPQFHLMIIADLIQENYIIISKFEHFHGRNIKTAVAVVDFFSY